MVECTDDTVGVVDANNASMPWPGLVRSGTRCLCTEHIKRTGSTQRMTTHPHRSTCSYTECHYSMPVSWNCWLRKQRAAKTRSYSFTDLTGWASGVGERCP